MRKWKFGYVRCENMSIEIIPKEEIKEEVESGFFSAIVHIENIKDPRLSEEQKMILLITYSRSVKSCISMTHGNINKIKYIKDPSLIYASGISDSIDYINEFIENIESYAEDSEEPIIDIFEGEFDITIAKLKLLLAQIYIMGIGNTADLHYKNKLNEKIAKAIEDIEDMLWDYLAEYPKVPEATWERMRNRFGFKAVF